MTLAKAWAQHVDRNPCHNAPALLGDSGEGRPQSMIQAWSEIDTQSTKSCLDQLPQQLLLQDLKFVSEAVGCDCQRAWNNALGITI